MTHLDPLLQSATGRLYCFLEYTCGRQHPGNTSLRKLWGQYLDAADEADLYAKLASVAQLPAQSEEEMGRLLDPPYPLDEMLQPLKSMPALTQFFGALDQSADRVRDTFDAGGLTVLRFSALLINRELKPQKAVAEEELADVRKAAQEFLDLINTTDLDPELLRVLLEHTHAILRAVDLYKVVGTQGLQNELDRLHGHIFRSSELFEPAVRKPGHLRDKFMKMVLTLGAATTLLNAPLAIAESVGEYHALLTSGSPTSVEAPAAPDASGENA